MRNLSLLLMFGVSPLLWANTLDDIRFAELPGERFEVRMSFSGTPPEPAGYTIEQPARIVLDFPNVESRLKERRYPLSFDNGNSAMVLSSGGRTRLILNLDEVTGYTARTEGNIYIVEVGAGSGGYATAPVETAAPVAAPRAAGPARSGPAITNIDFRRGEAGEGRIIIALSEPNVSADMSQTGAGVRLNFGNVWLPAELRRRLDVVDFATPVSLIAASYDTQGTTLNIHASGEYDYLAYQADNQYVVSIKPLTQREVEDRRELFAYTGDKLSLNFQDIEVRAVLQLIADFTNLNLVASDTVSGRITLRLDNVPWDQALDLVLRTKGLDKRVVGNVMMVAPASEIAERERQELMNRRQMEELAPMRTEHIRVRYANARDVLQLSRGTATAATGTGTQRGAGAGGLVSERGSAMVDDRTNSIILTDTAERIEGFKRLVEQVDIPIRQVMIEARIVIANTDFRREMGIRWGGVAYRQTGSSLLEVGGSTAALQPAGTTPSQFLTGTGAIDLNQNMMVDLGVANPAGSLALGLLTDNAFLDLELSALENTGYAEIVSQPKVITGDKQPAVILSGTEVPYQEASASGATTTAFKEAVLRLDVTPQITPDNRVIMDLIINQDSIGAINQATGIPTIDVTELQTKVLVANGQTIVLGGVFTVEQLRGEDKVPLLGDIPFLGRLFKRNITDQQKRELLIFITPKIMADSLTN